MAARSRWRIVVMLVLLLSAFIWSQLGRRPGVASLAVAAAAPDVLHLGDVTLEPCSIGRADLGLPTLRAYCTAISVPENRGRARRAPSKL